VLSGPEKLRIFWVSNMSNDNRKKEFLRLANDRLLDSEARTDLFSKLAGGKMDRNFVAREGKKARKAYEKSRKMHGDFSSQLAALQGKVDSSLNDMNAARDAMIDFNKILQVMDLIGATEAKKEKSGDCSYVVDGNRMYADTSNYSDIKLMPWKDRPMHSDDGEEDDKPVDLVEEMRLAEEDPFDFLPDDSDDEKDDEEELSERDSLDWEPADLKDDDYDLDMMFDPYHERVAAVESSVIQKVSKRFR